MSTEESSAGATETDLQVAQRVIEQHKAERLRDFQRELEELQARYGLKLTVTQSFITAKFSD